MATMASLAIREANAKERIIASVEALGADTPLRASTGRHTHVIRAVFLEDLASILESLVAKRIVPPLVEDAGSKEAAKKAGRR